MGELQNTAAKHDSSENPLLSLIPRGLRHFATGELLDKLKSFRLEDRLNAVAVIGSPKDSESARALAIAVTEDKSLIVKSRAAQSLSVTSFEDAQKILALGALHSPSIDSKKYCLAALKYCASPEIHRLLVGCLRNDCAPEVLSAAADILQRSNDKSIRQALAALVREGPPLGSIYASRCLKGTKDSAELDALVDAVNRNTSWQQLLTGPGAEAAIQAGARAAAQALQGLSSARHAARLVNGLEHPNEGVRAMSALALENCKVAGVGLAILERLKREESNKVTRGLDVTLRSLNE